MGIASQAPVAFYQNLYNNVHMDLLSYLIPKRLPAPQFQPGQAPEGFDEKRLGPKEVYLAWEAPGRTIHQGYNEKLMRTFAIIGVFIALFLVILQEYMLILVVASMIFVGQVLAKTPPENVKFEISSYGIMTDDQLYYWHDLRRFFFFEKEGITILAVDTLTGFPSRLFLNVTKDQAAKAKQVLDQRLQYLEQEPETLLDRTYRAVTSKFVS